MTTFPDFSTAPLREGSENADAEVDAAATATASDSAADAVWETPEGIDVKRVYTKADRDGVEAGTTATDDGEGAPMWSPDGRQIAFLRSREGVFIMSPIGGVERKVASSGSMLGWTPDSRSLLVRDRTGQAPFGIFEIDLETGRPKTLPAYLPVETFPVRVEDGVIKLEVR